MAVTVDAFASATGLNITLTFSHTCSGTERYLVVGVSRGLSPGTITGVTYAGVAMTSIGTSAGATLVHLWGLIAPATGANDVVVTASAAGNGIVAGAISYNGVDQTTPNSGFAAAGALTVNVTSAVNDMVMDTVSSDGGSAYTPGANQTERWDVAQTGGGDSFSGAGSHEAGQATVTMSWTGGGASPRIGAVSVEAAGGAGPAGAVAYAPNRNIQINYGGTFAGAGRGVFGRVRRPRGRWGSLRAARVI